MRGVLTLVGVTTLVFVALLVLARRRSETTWTSERYEREREGGTALGNAILATQAAFDPGARHALEQRNAEDADQIESGAPPDPGDDEVTDR
jgi:hypothetical protein